MPRATRRQRFECLPPYSSAQLAEGRKHRETARGYGSHDDPGKACKNGASRPTLSAEHGGFALIRQVLTAKSAATGSVVSANFNRKQLSFKGLERFGSFVRDASVK